ncbi:MAG TPA: CAP domain-containing protein [Verrucomicrobiae bacterium]|nr:CAP domain-containing protein [Verrucomicrobiae bacterium]
MSLLIERTAGAAARVSLKLLVMSLPWLGFGIYGQSTPAPIAGPLIKAPPPAPPIYQIASPPGGSGPPAKPLGLIGYSIGQPTDEEQLYLELLNRMRANPTAEGIRLAASTDPDILSAYTRFGVDLNLMKLEFATNPPVPPLAMNAQLTAAARWHSGDMFTNQYQGHFQTNGTLVLDPGARIATNGYKASAWGENVYSYSDSVEFGHAGFAVDWGPGTGGMQNPAGHRQNMLSPVFREVGVGVVDGVNGSVGPQLVTEDFGSQSGSPAFITGVVYFDLNGNGAYDIGEGIGGIMINTPGSTYFALSANSGGYAIPVTSNGNYVLTFTATGLSNQVSVSISGLHNAKVDYALSYSPPSISGPTPATLNQPNTYTFTAVPGATGYQWLQAGLAAYGLVEGAENGLANVTAVTTPGYSVINSDFQASGSSSFNLAHLQPTAQTLSLNANLLVRTNSQLTFAEMLGYAANNEVAQAQISTDGGQTWQTLWSEAGNDGSSPVDSSFLNQNISLGSYAGQVVQVRFTYLFLSGTYFQPQSGLPVGFFVDNIAVSNAEQVTGAVTNTVSSGSSFAFTPTLATNYLLQVRPQLGSRILAWGPPFRLSVSDSTPAPVINVISAPVLSGGQVQIDFAVTSYRSGMSLQLLRSSDLGGSWTQDTSASLQTIVPNSQFRFTTSTAGAQHLFFKVRGL